MKYEFIEINNFIVASASAEHYEADLKLYRKLFPESGILKDLENPFPPKKRELDERMLFEILNADRICMETINDNRSIITQIIVKAKEITLPAATDAYIKQLMDADLENLKYNDLKPLVFGLKLTVQDQKTVTLKAALAEFKANIIAESVTKEVQPTGELPANDASNTDAPNVDELPEGEKKS